MPSALKRAMVSRTSSSWSRSQNGCAQTATPPAAWMSADGLGDGGGRAAAVGGGAGDEVGLEDLARVGEVLGVQARAVARVVDDGLGEMGAADGLALRLPLDQRCAGQLEAELAQGVRHAVRAPRPVLPELRERAREAGVAVVEAVPEDVEVLVVAVERRDLGGGDDPDRPELRGRRERLRRPRRRSRGRSARGARPPLRPRAGRPRPAAASRRSGSSATGGRRSGRRPSRGRGLYVCDTARRHTKA